MNNPAILTPTEARTLIREGKWNKPTSGMAAGYTQANLAILKKELAFEFLLFCQRNPKPCPVLDVTEAGSPVPQLIAPDADIRTDIPAYRVYKHGELVDEVPDILSYWEDDMVAFLLGCSFTFEQAMLKNNIPVRHIEEDCNVPMYQTNIPCIKAGRFEGPMVVSMRPVPEKDVVRAVQVTSRFPAVHGAPVHVGNPASIGIRDIHRPDFGDSVTVKEGEVPVFWACGVTPQAVAMHMKPEIMITHAPGHMFITDMHEEQYSVL
ncbi:putative hydro-lyase [Aneurinibacillus aneurinilyticus]|uniref:Putative hydro-lyase HF838_14415 n=1 Tax=Aneurinibacillus aneurinilyticus TaxID=1391 RepID=A0A848CWD1_ANEAE|nr:putative hydro-lyase [Aneurinibacillus aneurinilyticus]NME99448.1 putative hydro-lyase [Aneurinibacillus aneurinilyticus]